MTDRTDDILAARWGTEPNTDLGDTRIVAHTPDGPVGIADLTYNAQVAEHVADAHNAWLDGRARVGRCGNLCPTPSPAPRQVQLCALPAGHPGWHRGDGHPFAAEWGPAPGLLDDGNAKRLRGLLSAPTTAERQSPAVQSTPKPDPAS